MITMEFLKRKGAGRFFIIFVSALFLVFTGCDSKKKEASTEVQTEAQTKAPANHPAADITESMAQAAHAVRPATREVTISEEVRNKWKEVQLQITDMAQQNTQLITLKVGDSIRLNNKGEYLVVEVFIPDYSIIDKRIESRSNEPNNPAVLVNLTYEGEVMEKGWIFKHYPEFNSFVNKRFRLVLVGPGKDLPAP
jgi:hypothetical protein